MSHCPSKTSSYIFIPLLWGITLGVVGFVSGFIGPIVFSPGANQGPLLGIFFTGPGGLILGGIIGLSLAPKGYGWKKHFKLILLVSFIGAVLILLPCVFIRSTIDHGLVIDGEIKGCRYPEEIIEKKVAEWRDDFNDYEYLQPRQDWEDGLSKMVNQDRGVILTLKVTRQWNIYEEGQFWERGVLRAREIRRDTGKDFNYFARFKGNSCTKYLTGTRYLLSLQWESSQETPPDKLPAFLKMAVLSPAPENYIELTRD